MDQKVYEHVKKYWESKGYGTPDEEGAVEIIREADVVWSKELWSQRWWDVYEYVVEIDGLYIGFEDARTTGDMSASEAGYDFDEDSICFYEPKTVTIVEYQPKV